MEIVGGLAEDQPVVADVSGLNRGARVRIVDDSPSS
jgi:hypothetical protein